MGNRLRITLLHRSLAPASATRLQHKGGKKTDSERERDRCKHHFCVLPFFAPRPLSHAHTLSLSLSRSLSLSAQQIPVHNFRTSVSRGSKSNLTLGQSKLPCCHVWCLERSPRTGDSTSQLKTNIFFFYTSCTRFPSGRNKCREVWAPRMIRFDNLIVIIICSNRPAQLFRTQRLRNGWRQCFPNIFARGPILA